MQVGLQRSRDPSANFCRPGFEDGGTSDTSYSPSDQSTSWVLSGPRSTLDFSCGIDMNWLGFGCDSNQVLRNKWSYHIPSICNLCEDLNVFSQLFIYPSIHPVIHPSHLFFQCFTDSYQCFYPAIEIQLSSGLSTYRAMHRKLKRKTSKGGAQVVILSAIRFVHL